MKPDLESIRSIVSSVTGLPAVELEGDADFLASGLLDSLQVVEIAGALEDRFGIRLDPWDFIPRNFANLRALLALCRSRVPGTGRGAEVA